LETHNDRDDTKHEPPTTSSLLPAQRHKTNSPSSPINSIEDRLSTAALFLRKVVCALLPGSFWLKRRMRDGVIVTGRNRPGFGGRGFFVFGEALEPELGFLHHFLRKGDVFVDVGANSGVFSMKAARCVQEEGCVLALEPLPDMLYTLYRNVNLNGFSNVRLRNFCLSDQTGTAEFWINHGRPASSGLVRQDEQAARFSTLCFRLDELAAIEKLNRLDYLKIDVEGAETRILAGASGLIRQFKPIIQVEVTIDPVASLEGYVRCIYSGSPNCLLLPQGHRLLETCRRLGYKW
jgi:FkbM family methyltransferase